MIVDRDYVYIFGPEWADEFLNCIERDRLAQGTMAQYGLTSDDLRSYYLAQPHFDRIYRQLIDNGDDFVNDPVDTLLQAVRTAKDSVKQARSTFEHEYIQKRFLPPANPSKYGQVKPRRQQAGGMMNPVAMFMRLIMS